MSTKTGGAVEILCGLWLADLNATTHDAVKQRTQVFVSVCKSDLRKYDIFVRDIEKKLLIVQSFSADFCKVIYAIDEHLRAGESVTVFCETGHQRSAAMVAAYLIAFAGMSATNAIACIRSKSENAFVGGSVYSSLLSTFEKQFVSTSTAW